MTAACAMLPFVLLSSAPKHSVRGAPQAQFLFSAPLRPTGAFCSSLSTSNALSQLPVVGTGAASVRGAFVALRRAPLPHVLAPKATAALPGRLGTHARWMSTNSGRSVVKSVWVQAHRRAATGLKALGSPIEFDLAPGMDVHTLIEAAKQTVTLPKALKEFDSSLLSLFASINIAESWLASTEGAQPLEHSLAVEPLTATTSKDPLVLLAPDFCWHKLSLPRNLRELEAMERDLVPLRARCRLNQPAADPDKPFLSRADFAKDLQKVAQEQLVTLQKSSGKGLQKQQVLFLDMSAPSGLGKTMAGKKALSILSECDPSRYPELAAAAKHYYFIDFNGGDPKQIGNDSDIELCDRFSGRLSQPYVGPNLFVLAMYIRCILEITTKDFMRYFYPEPVSGWYSIESVMRLLQQKLQRKQSPDQWNIIVLHIDEAHRARAIIDRKDLLSHLCQIRNYRMTSAAFNDKLLLLPVLTQTELWSLHPSSGTVRDMQLELLHYNETSAELVKPQQLSDFPPQAVRALKRTLGDMGMYGRAFYFLERHRESIVKSLTAGVLRVLTKDLTNEAEADPRLRDLLAPALLAPSTATLNSVYAAACDTAASPSAPRWAEKIKRAWEDGQGDAPDVVAAIVREHADWGMNLAIFETAELQDAAPLFLHALKGSYLSIDSEFILHNKPQTLRDLSQQGRLLLQSVYPANRAWHLKFTPLQLHLQRGGWPSHFNLGALFPEFPVNLNTSSLGRLLKVDTVKMVLLRILLHAQIKVPNSLCWENIFPGAQACGIIDDIPMPQDTKYHYHSSEASWKTDSYPTLALTGANEADSTQIGESKTRKSPPPWSKYMYDGRVIIRRPRDSEGKPMVIMISNTMALTEQTSPANPKFLKKKMLDFFKSRGKVEAAFPGHTVLMLWTTTHKMELMVDPNVSPSLCSSLKQKNCLLLDQTGFLKFHHLCAHRYLQD
eukprot:TRINITY_DN4671_c0_g1_i1.p1 TRINITY_DN4671_c0_g1~~TRINITY_DN4671_c0_g1_i1.p1  ORF type:complete len:951 (-),score=174.00 TRINITY_DN4671_c0_g1_i1:63-2915(-)